MYPGSTLHQIGPYIGKIRPSLARHLVMRYSKVGDWIWDPFCGSGTIALESMLLSRNVIASDINPYACALTRAKLHAPQAESIAVNQLNYAIQILSEIKNRRHLEVPTWVNSFFHKKTLIETLSLMNEFIRRKQHFHIGCLLDILHHQRPGFLSYPASHLIPYLRDKLYPRDKYPEAYGYRDPVDRLKAKISRSLMSPPPNVDSRFRVFQKSVLRKYLPDDSVDAVITSPPYMDALDYARDNRLRLWFLGIHEYGTIKRDEIGRISTFEEDMLAAFHIMSIVIKIGGLCVLVLGDVTRKNRRHDVPALIIDLVKRKFRSLSLEKKKWEYLPDQRRSRRNGKATKKEYTLVFRRVR